MKLIIPFLDLKDHYLFFVFAVNGAVNFTISKRPNMRRVNGKGLANNMCVEIHFRSHAVHHSLALKLVNKVEMFSIWNKINVEGFIRNKFQVNLLLQGHVL